MDTGTIVAIVLAIFASSGFWTFVIAVLQHRWSKKSTENRLLLGLAQDRIVHLGKTYIKRGDITNDEFETLHDALYLPYREMGGNGVAKRVMDEVEKLPIK
jgi:hypothetical protein